MEREEREEGDIKNCNKKWGGRRALKFNRKLNGGQKDLRTNHRI